jgi:hypothetical protein
MSEATGQETAVKETEKEAPKYDESNLDDFGRQFVARTSSQIERANSLAAEIKANSTDKNEIATGVVDALKNATLPEGITGVTKKELDEYNAIVIREIELAEKFKKVAAEYAEKKASENQDTEKLTELTTEYETLTKKIRQSRNMLATEFPGAETLLPNLAGTKSGSSGSGRGAGGRKMRGFTVSVDGNVAMLNDKSSFAAGASVLGIPTPDLQTAYFAAVGTDDMEKLPPSAEFVVKGKDEKDHKVTAVKNAE